LLYILYEGCYPQITVLPIIILFIYYTKYLFLKNIKKEQVLVFAILFVGSSSIYLESPFLILPIFVMICLFNYRKIDSKSIILIFVFSFLLNFQIFKEIYFFQIENIKHLNLAGWPQPKWSMLNDIFGLHNIYSGLLGNDPNFIDKNPNDNFYQLLINLLIFIFILSIYIFDYSFIVVISLIIIIFLFFLYFKYIKNVNSYAYMKIYTSYIPLLMIFFYKLQPRNITLKYYLFFPLILSTIVIYNGFGFINSYYRSYSYVTDNMLQLTHLKESFNIKENLVIPISDTDQFSKIRDIFIRSLVDTHLVHLEYIASQNFSGHHNHNVLLLVNNSSFTATNVNDIVWAGHQYTLINTHLPFKNIWVDRDNIPKFIPIPYDISRPEIELRFAKHNRDNHINQKLTLEPFLQSVKKNK